MRFTFEITQKTRYIFNSFLEDYTLEQLTKVPEGFSNSIFWNIKHVVVTQQLLVYKLSGLPLLVSEAAVLAYKKGTYPSDATVTQEDVNVLKKQLFTTLEQTQKDYQKGLFKKFTPYTVSTNTTLNNVDEALEFNNFHEGIHLGVLFGLRRFV
jgi:hypothetical protein